MKELSALHIGEEAARLMKNGGRARVVGSTSKGIFSITDTKDVFFLSYEPYRSPITINLAAADDDLRRVEIGDIVELASGRMVFNRTLVLVAATGEQTWQTPAPSEKVSPREQWAERIRRIAVGIEEGKPDIGFSPMVSVHVLGHEPAALMDENKRVSTRIAEVFKRARERDLFAVLLHLEALLGFGRGLTPSGDDFALGFLLAINRWGRALGWEADTVSMFNDSMMRTAPQKTTSLSAGLVRLAAQGKGDERQVAVIDGIMSGDPSVEQCLQFTLEMGSSSGIDSFLGMAAGVL